MVPGSTFKYGSHFCKVTRRPRLSSRQPIDAAATPLPREETTPPVTKIYFGPIRAGYAPPKSPAGRKTVFFLLGSRCTTHFTENGGGLSTRACGTRQKLLRSLH